MSEEKKKRTTWQWIEIAAKVIGWFGGLGVLFLILFQVKFLTFTDAGIKVKTEDYMESIDPVKQAKMEQLDSINKVNAIESRKLRDSLLIQFGEDVKEIKNEQKRFDSINILNADQIFQIKEAINNNN